MEQACWPFWQVHNILHPILNSSPSLYVSPSTSHDFASFAELKTNECNYYLHLFQYVGEVYLKQDVNSIDMLHITTFGVSEYFFF